MTISLCIISGRPSFSRLGQLMSMALTSMSGLFPKAARKSSSLPLIALIYRQNVSENEECSVESGVVWCGVVWCGVVWCGVVWCGVVWCGVVWCGVDGSDT
jgi:hypothetical protein